MLGQDLAFAVRFVLVSVFRMTDLSLIYIYSSLGRLWQAIATPGPGELIPSWPAPLSKSATSDGHRRRHHARRLVSQMSQRAVACVKQTPLNIRPIVLVLGGENLSDTLELELIQDLYPVKPEAPWNESPPSWQSWPLSIGYLLYQADPSSYPGDINTKSTKEGLRHLTSKRKQNLSQRAPTLTAHHHDGS